MKLINVRLDGVGALLCHSDELANRYSETTQALASLTSKRTKTDDDHARIAELEYLGGCYLTDDNRLGIPTWNILRSIQDGAKLNRLGKAVERALIPAGVDVVGIDYAGPSTPREAFEAGCFDQRCVGVSQKRITRTRPRFTDWSCTAMFALDESVLDLDDLQASADNAGSYVGLGDYRPRYGRYEATISEVSA